MPLLMYSYPFLHLLIHLLHLYFLQDTHLAVVFPAYFEDYSKGAASQFSYDFELL